MSTIRKPMTACKVEWDRLNYPVLASPKLDGVRCVVYNGIGYGRSLKPLPNLHLQSLLKDPRLENLDMEIVVGSPTDPNLMQKTMSAVMSVNGKPDFQLFVFDIVDSENPTLTRQLMLNDRGLPEYARIHTQTLFSDETSVKEYEKVCMDVGYEGLILRNPRSMYKHGRSTMTDQALMKVKTFSDGEAVVIGVEPLYRNQNPAFLNELGLQTRSTEQAGLVADDLLGALIVRDLVSQVEFKIGTGFTMTDRQVLWENRERLNGLIVHYRSFTQQGVVNAPRHPVYHGFRNAIDLESEDCVV